MRKRWILAKRFPKDFKEKLSGFSDIEIQLFYNRGIKSKDEAEKFLNPSYEKDLNDPLLLPDVEKAVARIDRAIDEGERITIYGDYDADGLCGTTILADALQRMGCEDLTTYFPSRQDEGYGLNIPAVEKLAKEGTKLIITNDCGVRDVEEVERANQLGVDVIITDHHTVPDKIPSAHAIVHPKIPGSKYPFPELAGAGVVFKFVQALRSSKNWRLKPGREKWWLDLAALATVADIMPLIKENRAIVHYGLLVLEKTKRLGLQMMMGVAGIDPERVSSYTLGFQLGPRLNAAGRLKSPRIAYDLLSTRNIDEARIFAREVEEINLERQDLTERVFKEAIKGFTPVDSSRPLLFAANRNWPIGIIGLVAGNVMQDTNHPTVLIEKGEKECKGSARSIPQYNITEALTRQMDLLENFGGHVQAAGFTLKTKNLGEFQKRMEEDARERITEDDLVSVISVDAELQPYDLSLDLAKTLQRFAPFGKGNPRPKFIIRGAEVRDFRTVGRGSEHLQAKLAFANTVVKAIGFGMGKRMKELKMKERLDVVGEVSINVWHGQKELQIELVDFNRTK